MTEAVAAGPRGPAATRKLAREFFNMPPDARYPSCVRQVRSRITIPQEVRDALGIAEGDQVIFRVEQHRALLAKTPNLLDLAGV